MCLLVGEGGEIDLHPTEEMQTWSEPEEKQEVKINEQLEPDQQEELKKVVKDRCLQLPTGENFDGQDEDRNGGRVPSTVTTIPDPSRQAGDAAG